MEATSNSLIITIATKYIRNISDILKRADIQNLSTVSPTDLVQIVGKVISIPKKISTRKDYEDFSIKDIQIGDTIIFRYDVVYDLKSVSENENIYKNMFDYHAEEFWLCDIQKAFGVIRDNQIIMINGYVMIEDYNEDVIYLPKHQKRQKGTKYSKIIEIGHNKTSEKPINAQKGDLVFFNGNKTSKYQINGKPFRIIQQKFIYGKAL